MRLLQGILLFLSLLTPHLASAQVTRFEVTWPHRRVWVGATGVEGVKVRAVDAEGRLVKDHARPLRFEGLTLTASVSTADGVAELPGVDLTSAAFTIGDGVIETRHEVPALAGLWSLLPALLAIVLALTTRQVLLSLFGGVWLGAWLLSGSFLGAFPGSLDIVTAVVADGDKIKIITFTLLMGGLVGIISVNGGTNGIVQAVARRAHDARSGSLATWGMGMLVFFDDYASSLLIGTTMRPITDRLQISREKLSYIVDSTAAPISSLALISTWIGYEVSVLGDAMKAAGIQRDPYEVFLSGLGSRYYQWLALIFVVVVAIMGRDFGPMLKAERRARREGKLIRDGGAPLMDAGLMKEAEASLNAPPRWWLAGLPLVVLVGTVLAVLVFTGLDAAASDPATYLAARQAGLTRTLGFILGNAASYDALVYAGAASASLALVLSVVAKALSMEQSITAFVNGLRAMILAVVVLALAWSIGKVMDDLKAGAFVAELAGSAIPAWALSSVTFLLAALMAFATGTSWGTMAILFPIVIPVVALHGGTAGFESVLLGTSSAVLAGAVFGDHCSPISDTTVLSSIASASDHVDHTRTQGPYAVLCAIVALIFGYIPYSLGAPPWLLIGVGTAVLVGFLRMFGENPD
ncbi:MAG: Na+/H+ antiporter NhaC family protein [Deltaproteobacteria bacterium]|nr:Na+/H+ antiporter NhaC family protein [Deltaproteobacteria bacterium]